MVDLNASNKRLVDTYRGRKADRVPMFSPISWSPLQDIDKEKPGGWRADKGFIKVARLTQEFCDPRPSFNQVRHPEVWSPVPGGYQRFLEAEQEHYETLPPEDIGQKRNETHVYPPYSQRRLKIRIR